LKIPARAEINAAIPAKISGVLDRISEYQNTGLANISRISMILLLRLKMIQMFQ
jgi:hypothetical protein